MSKCPRCEGRRGAWTIHGRWWPCDLCKEIGTVTQRRLDAYNVGRKLRNTRVERGESLGEAANMCGMTVLEYANLERGVQALDVEATDE